MQSDSSNDTLDRYNTNTLNELKTILQSAIVHVRDFQTHLEKYNHSRHDENLVNNLLNYLPTSHKISVIMIRLEYIHSLSQFERYYASIIREILKAIQIKLDESMNDAEVSDALKKHMLETMKLIKIAIITTDQRLTPPQGPCL